MKINFKEIGLILLVSVLSSILFNSFSANPVDYIYKAPIITNNSVLSLEDAKKIFDEKAALFIDARPNSQFKRNRIKSAINVPYNAPNKQQLMSDIAKDVNIVVYCYSKRCNQARRLSDALKKMGYKHVALFEDGIVEWKRSNFPIDEK